MKKRWFVLQLRVLLLLFLSSDNQQLSPVSFVSVNLPFLRQVPSKMPWLGVAHRTHSKGRKIRIFAHESPCAESSHHHLHARASATSGGESHQTFDTTEQACPGLRTALTRRAELPLVAARCFLRDPLLWNPGSLLPLVWPVTQRKSSVTHVYLDYF